MSQGTTKGVPIDVDGTLSADSDVLVASQKATKTYADTKQAQLNGTGFVKATGTTISYDNTTYLSSISSSDVTTALGFTPYNSTNPNNYISSITSSNVTTALGYTPVTNARTITINGTTQDLSADRTFTITAGNTAGINLANYYNFF